jgi:zinc transport system ATP-binding protein
LPPFESPLARPPATAPDAAGALLELDGLVVGWSEPLFGPLSLRLAAGEVLGLWGANGSGKSTLLAAITGQARCFDGQLRLAPGVELAMQPQAPVRFAPLPVTGRELLRIAGVDAGADQGDDPGADGLPPTLARVLGCRLDRISGGQYQLLCVWAALAGRARLVLLDEPTNNLDPTHTALLGDMLAARRADRAVLLVSHERPFLDAHCTRVLELDG